MATIAEQMAANSAAWKTATPQMQTQLHQANLDLAKQTGQSYNAAQGTYSAPMSATAAGLPNGSTPTATPSSSPAPGSAASAQAWINNPNSGQGGLDAYTAKQNERYAGALSANDTDLANRLTADSQRVGYTLNAPKPVVANMPMPVSATNSYQPPDYAALAAARTAAALAQKKSIADAQKSSLDRSFARDNQITNDNRTLENGQINRTLSPFSGKTAYDKGIIGRERSLVDENKSNNLSAQKANIDQLLADYENATADEQVRIADELQRADRQYQLDLSNATGNLTDLKTGQTQRTLQGQQFDYNTNPNNPSNIGQQLNNQGQVLQNQLAQYQLDNYPAEAKAKATILEQQVKSGAMSNEAAAYNLSQLKDPNSAVNQANKIDLQIKSLELKNLPEKQRLELQQLQKQNAEIGKVHYKPQTATEIAMDQANLKILQSKADELTNGTGNLKSDKDISDLLDSSPLVTKQLDDNGKVIGTIVSDTNKAQMAQYIASLGLPAAEAKKWFVRYGLPLSGN